MAILLPPDAFKRVASGRQRTVVVPIPTRNVSIERLPGEGRSAWRIRRSRGKLTGTRLEPFLPGQAVWIQEEGTGRVTVPHRMQSYRVSLRDGAWVWLVRIAPLKVRMTLLRG